MTLTQFEYALAVEQYKNFSKAAKICFVTQPTLSAQIQKLEEELGVILFDRSKSPVKITLEGKKYLIKMKQIIIESKNLLSMSKDENKINEGEIKIGVIPTIAPYLIPKIIKAFIKNHPKIKLTFFELTTKELIKSLETDEIDTGILATPIGEHSFFERTLFNEPFLIYISDKHKLKKQKQILTSDLKKEKLWLLSEGHCFRNQMLNICSIDHKNFFENIKFESGQIETLKNIINENSGATLIPYMAKEYIKDKSHIKEFKGVTPTREISLLVNRFFYKEKLIDILEEEILNSIPTELSSLKKIKTIPLD